MITDEQIRLFSQYCSENFGTELKSVRKSERYQSLPICVLDCVYSLRTKYFAVTVPVLQRYADTYMGGNLYAGQDTLSDFITHIKEFSDCSEFAKTVLKNNQVLSGRNKAEVCYEIATKLHELLNMDTFVFSLYVFWLLNHSNQQEADETLRAFSNEIPLLEEIYLKGISYSQHEDFDGALLYAIISVDAEFLYRYLDCLIANQGDYFRMDDDYDIARLLRIWDTEQYMDLADGVFDYCYSKREESKYWVYWSPVNMMLHYEASRWEIVVKQDLWMQHIIEKYGHDEDRMCLLFTAIEELSCERRRKAVEKFLALNADPDVFERLSLEPSHWGGIGSMIPDMQERIEYLRSLLPLVSGIKYLKQKQRIEREIGCWKERIHSEEVRELLESWYC